MEMPGALIKNLTTKNTKNTKGTKFLLCRFYHRGICGMWNVGCASPALLCPELVERGGRAR